MLASHEKVGGKSVHPQASSKIIQHFQDANISDLKFKGCKFTWSNRSMGVRGITSKLDRVLVNPQWLAEFNDSEAEFLPAGVSDHSPMVVSIFKKLHKGRKPFKFYNFWTQEI